MTSGFNRAYPPGGRILFDGGLNNKFERSLIEDNESPECRNVVFENGAVETRGGSDLFNTTSVGSFVCDGLFTRNNEASDTTTMVAWWNGTLHTLGGTSTFSTVASSESIFTGGELVCAAEYENYMFFGNGNSTPYKYGGSDGNFTRHGIPAPVSAVTLSTASTGTVLTGDYRYGVTYVNSNLVEGDISPISATFPAAGVNILVTSIPVAPASFGVNSRRLYRTVTSGSTFMLVTTISDNTTSTYEDGVADGGLGADAPTDQGEPPNYSTIIYHQGRLFVIDPSDQLVKYSEIGNPYVFKSTSFIRIGDTTGDIPTSLEIFDNSLVVHCRNSQWLIYMASTTESDWRAIKVRAPYGSRSPFGSFNYNNRVMFPATQNEKFVGFAAIAGDTLDPSSTLLTVSAAGSDLQSNRIEPDMFSVQSASLAKINSIVFKNKAYIALTYGAGNTANNRIYVFDFSISNLAKRNRTSWVPWTGINASHFTIYAGELYAADSSATGRIWKLNTATYNDNGAAIDSYYWTKEFSGRKGEENVYKDFRYAQIFYENSGDWFMNFTVRTDSDSGSGDTDQIDLDPGGSVWGAMVWGRDEWGGGSEEGEIRKFISPKRGKRIQFKFSNQNAVNQKFKVLGLNFVYNNKGLR